jgi:chromosome segregation protein
MRIKRLDICGFKSFPDKTTLVFDKPIVGVVGPNGCGKSNIVDAVRWVMGEQSIKSLRGRNREDVIFAGTEGRGSMGMAEVTLTFDNSDRRAPIEYADYNEISITRKLYRNGDSDYVVNNTPARLRDITDIFLGTGAGNKAYSIIEQGHISLIVGAKAEERRLMIEEAAGITKYHSRKREAERKMDHTRQNLLRVTDVVSELRKQLNSLSRQAKKAERYKELKGRIKDLELTFASMEYNRLLNEINAAVDRINELTELKEGRELKYLATEGEVNARNLNMAEREHELSERQERLYKLDQAIQLDERNLEIYEDETRRITGQEGELSEEFRQLEVALAQGRETLKALETEQGGLLALVQGKETELAQADEANRAALEAFNRQQMDVERNKRAIYEAMSEVDRADNKLEMLKHRIADNQQRRSGNRQEFDTQARRDEELTAERQVYIDQLGGLKQLAAELDTQRGEQSKKLAREREIYLDLEERLVAERDRLTAMRSRLDSLAELDKSLEGFSEGAKAALEDASGRFDSGEVVDALARLVDVNPAYEAAVAGILGDRLQWLLVAEPETGIKGISLLRETKAGSAGFVPMSGPEPMFSDELPEGATPLLEYVKPKREAREVFDRLLYDTLMVESLDIATRLWTETGGRFAFVTPSGDYVDRSGAVCGGSGESLSQTLLKRRRDMQELAENSHKQEAECEQLTQQRDARIAAIRELEQEVESTRQQEHKQEIKILEQEKDLHHLASQIDQTKRRIDALQRELQAYENERDRLEAEREQLSAERLAAIDKRQQAELALSEAQQALEGLAARRDAAMADLTQKRVAVAEARQRREHLDSELRSARARVDDLTQRQERLSFEEKRGQERLEEIKRLSAHTRIQVNQRITDREKQQQSLSNDKDAFNREQEEVRGLNEAIKALRHEMESIKGELSERQLQRQEMSLQARHQEERMYEKYGITLATEFMEYLPEEEPGEAERNEIDELRDKIERMGEVNLTAIAEHDRVSERYQFLMDQQDDLTRSLEMLESAIRKINRTTRKRFKETFEAVNAKFSELFPQLFGGGEAYLEFTDPNDLLNTGVEIIARPPGKNLQSVGLLSGGEKAMTALSLIFAIFLYRPTPFCLLDEVDAPLDDVNITRFNNALKKISKVSQFILITHNKKTMEITNTLYGVTMEEAGISKIVSVNLT